MTQELFDRATREATCDFLSSSGQGAVAYAAWGLLTPGPFDEFGAIAYAGLAKVAYDLGCNWDPNQIDPNPPSPIKGCSEVTGGVGTIGFTPGSTGNFNPFQSTGFNQAVKIIDIIEQSRDEVGITYTAVWEIAGSEQQGAERFISSYDYPTTISIRPTGDAVCAKNEEPKKEYNYDYTDPETGCSLTVSMEGYSVDSANRVSPVWQITAGGDGVRASGGVISGDCNFAPTVVVPDPNGPNGPSGPNGPTYLPTPDDPTPGPNGEPWWQSVLAGVAGGAAAGLVDAALSKFFSQKYPEIIYRHVSVCEKDAQGESISEQVKVEIPELTAPDAQIARLDAIVELLQAHKNFKQPICGNEKPVLLGDWVTTRWESDEKMVDSGRRLRKLLRYRTQSSRDLGQLSAYWRDFTWKSGPVCVIHKGAWWGTPQIWAQSAEEGKRVLRHAAAEAGLDPDKIGGWKISSSRSPRNGMSGTMKILRKEGYPWIASRQGTDWPNYLAS
jgi:hypothetical protein